MQRPSQWAYLDLAIHFDSHQRNQILKLHPTHAFAIDIDSRDVVDVEESSSENEVSYVLNIKMRSPMGQSNISHAADGSE
jgi:hypothetical protein